MKSEKRVSFDFFRLKALAFFVLIGLGYVQCLDAASADDPREKRPNIIVIIGDDISWNDFGCYGNDVVQTPNIDLLAKKGITFTNAYLTASSCSPSRCSIITGRYPHNTGAAELNTDMGEEQVGFPELMRKANYYTAHAGKWHFGNWGDPSGPMLRAFDEAESLESMRQHPGGEGLWIERLRNRPMDKPFFMWFASNDAHRVWTADGEDWGNDIDAIEIPPCLVNTEGTREDLLSYYNEISRLDSYVGQVVEELDSQGALSNTIIVVLADNGRAFPRDKTRLYDSGIKTPLVVHWPDGIERVGVRSRALLSSIDIAPTLLELAGIEITNTIQGRSFSEMLNNPGAKFRNYVFAEHNWHDFEAYERMAKSENFLYILNERPQFSSLGPADSIRGASMKELRVAKEEGRLRSSQLHLFQAPRPREEFYDCVADPHQLHNLIEEPEYVDQISIFREILVQWVEDTGDTLPNELTVDLFSRETGFKVMKTQKRGEMPGSRKGAELINAPGPF